MPDSRTMTEETKIAVMQEKINVLDRNMEKVLNNHLPHIQEELEGMRKDITLLKVSLARYIGIGIGSIAVIDVVIRVVFGK